MYLNLNLHWLKHRIFFIIGIGIILQQKILSESIYIFGWNIVYDYMLFGKKTSYFEKKAVNRIARKNPITSRNLKTGNCGERGAKKCLWQQKVLKYIFFHFFTLFLTFNNTFVWYIEFDLTDFDGGRKIVLLILVRIHGKRNCRRGNL